MLLKRRKEQVGDFIKRKVAGSRLTPIISRKACAYHLWPGGNRGQYPQYYYRFGGSGSSAHANRGWFWLHYLRRRQGKSGQGQKHPHLRHFRPCGYFGRLANYPFNRGIYRFKLAHFPNSQNIMKKFFAVSLSVFL